ncbi:MAG: glucan 1,4-alpha-glucosidase [Caldilineaceae bacterium]
MENSIAFGAPGIDPRWTTSAKSGVGTALSDSSRVWFTLSHGILDEVYYPRIDHASIRDLGLLVTNGSDFFSEEKRHTEHQVETLAPGIPAYRLSNTCTQGRYHIEKIVLCDPQRDTVLQRIRFQPQLGHLEDYQLFALLSPHLGNRGKENCGWVGDYKGFPMLYAQRDGLALALACSTPWKACSVGYVGASDGWQDLNQHRQMTWFFSHADNGNVALTGQFELTEGRDEFVVALGFGTSPMEAGQRALASLQDGFEVAQAHYLQQWQHWQKKLKVGKESPPLVRTSAAVLRTHEAKHFSGGMIASLSIPWGDSKGDNDLGGYHLVWPRDLVESAGGLLAVGAHEEVRRVLGYLQVTQEADGHWGQNMWLDGTSYWGGLQNDETAFPILLVDLARRNNALCDEQVARFWPMVRKAANYLQQSGPITGEDRWEEDAGYSPFTLAVEISALLVAAELADLIGESTFAGDLRRSADDWNHQIERWTYVTDTELARQVGVEGYYVRIAPPFNTGEPSIADDIIAIKNRLPGQESALAGQIVSPDALALVRFGLRAANDPRILNTVKVIDALLKTETPYGPLWHRYNDDGYGEHADGSPFDGTGIGRGWPLLTGERAHYELAAGNLAEANRLRQCLENFANKGGMLPEQSWDAPDIPERELFLGKPAGSAMPLAWAHSEYIKLCRSLQDGAVFDLPPQPVARYRSQ